MLSTSDRGCKQAARKAAAGIPGDRMRVGDTGM
jgi:hypothetical protein